MDCSFEYWRPTHAFTLSIAYSVFGIDEKYAYWVITIIASLSIILIFMLAYLITKSARVSLYSALLLCFLPIHLKLSGSMASEVTSFFFIVLCLVLFEILLQVRNLKFMLLFVLILVFAAQLRAENILLIFIFLVDIIFRIKKIDFKIEKMILPGIILIILIVPYLSGYLINTEDWDFYNHSLVQRLDYVKENIFDSIIFWFDN